ncbi:MAG: hypothetical protein RL748_2444, partial [Pseudomonadota bacterium]
HAPALGHCTGMELGYARLVILLTGILEGISDLIDFCYRPLNG